MMSSNAKKKKKPLAPPSKQLILTIIGCLVVLVITIWLVLHFFSPRSLTWLDPAARLENKLDDQALDVFKKEIQAPDLTPGTYTINLKYLQNHNYNISSYEEAGCDLTGTYVIIYVGADGSIINSTTQLNCGE